MVLSDGGNQLEEIIFWGSVEASSLLLVRFLAAHFSTWRIRGAKAMFKMTQNRGTKGIR